MLYKSRFQLPNSYEVAPSKSRTYVDVEVKHLAENFRGLFVKESVAEGTVLACDGGVVVSSLNDDMMNLNYIGLIDEKLWLAPQDFNNPEPVYFINHSCDSNVARYGGLIYVAKRDIFSGEQLTIDYAPLISEYNDFQFECLCQSQFCRQTVTSADWKNPVLAKKLWREWLPYIQKKLGRQNL